METSKKIFDLGEIPKIVPSRKSANSLFQFMTKLEYLEESLLQMAFFPRYCEEDISYLGLSNNSGKIDKVACAEKCFCDIPLHELKKHAGTYGRFGIGLSKSWGMANGLQPIQYMNKVSPLADDLRVCFSESDSISATDNVARGLSNYLISHILYMKPVFGKNRNRVTDEYEDACLADESEWRYIPVLPEDCDMSVIYHKLFITQERLNILSEGLKRIKESWLSFELKDIKYLFVDTEDSKKLLIEFIFHKTKFAEDDKFAYSAPAVS